MKETRTFHIDGYDYSFNFSTFKRFFNAYKTNEHCSITSAERKLADTLNLSCEAIHSWRFEKSGPADTETIKQLADALGIHDHKILLEKKIGENNMTINDRYIDSLKKIYDSIILYLDDFETSNGFNDYWFIKAEEGYPEKAIEKALYELASSKLHEVEIVLKQEYIVLHKLDIYDKLENFIYDDLCNLWDGKLEYGYRFECVVEDTNGNRGLSASEESAIALNTLNELMSEYF